MTFKENKEEKDPAMFKEENDYCHLKLVYNTQLFVIGQ
jgi:hypothetical protein